MVSTSLGNRRGISKQPSNQQVYQVSYTQQGSKLFESHINQIRILGNQVLHLKDFVPLVDSLLVQSFDINLLKNSAGLKSQGVVEALNRGKTADKFLDYGVGFVLGLLSSGFILVIQRFTTSRQRLATQRTST